MKAFVALFLLASLATSAAQTAPRLEGTWKSDRALTMTFARQRNKLEAKTESLWSEMVGKMTLTISDKEIRSEMAGWDVPIEGKPYHMEGFSGSSSYKIVFSDKSVIVAISKNPATGASEATTYNFVGPDTFWVYTGRGDDESPGSHLREYFRRVPVQRD